MHYFAMSILAYELMQSAIGVGSVFMTISLSMVIIGPIAGALIDREDPRRLITVSAFGAAFVTGAISVVNSFGVFLALELALNILLTFYYPVFNTVIPDMVEADTLAEANALMALSTRAAQLVGPAIGAICLLVWDVRALFLIDAATFIVVSLLVACSGLKAAPTRNESSQNLVVAIKNGFGLINKSTVVRSVVWYASIPVGAALGVSTALTYVFANEILQVGSSAFAMLVSSLAIGLAAGSAAVGRLRCSFSLMSIAIIGLCLGTVGFFAFAVSRTLAIASIGRFMVGVGYALYSISALTMVQQATQRESMGVVLTSWRSIENVSTTMLLASAAIIADTVGIGYAIYLSGVLTLIAVVGMWSVKLTLSLEATTIDGGRNISTS